MGQALAAIFLLLSTTLSGAESDYTAARRKLDLIESDRLRPGSRVVLTSAELNAVARHEVADAAPDGVRNPQLELGVNAAAGTALVNFAKLQRSRGESPGWLMSKLLEGERSVKVSSRIRSGGGQATVDIDRVEIGGVAIQGAVLDYLIRDYLLPRFPGAKIGEPFRLGHRIDHFDIEPNAVTVVIGR